jgi:hypothetical protein
MIRKRMVLAVILISAVFGIWSSAQTRRVPVIRQIDHILIQSSNPKALFNFFSDTLQLPTAWPITENQGFITGGIGTGNVNLEIFRYPEKNVKPDSRVPNAIYSGLAFEPYLLADSLLELQLRGIPYNPPQPSVSALPNGSHGVAWTTVELPSFSKPGMSVFLYEYSPLFLKVDVRRKQLANRLTLQNGGALGALSVEEVVIASTNAKKDNEKWRLLLGKATSSGSWLAGAGPAIRIIPGDRDGIREIILTVKSLDFATAFMKQNKLLGTVSEKGIFLIPSKVQGLRILVRSAP